MLVTDGASLSEPCGAERIAAAVRGGVGLVQLRDRRAGAGELLLRARRLKAVLPDTPLIVNDRVDVALAVGAAGVQLSVGALPISEACSLLGAGPLIGRSVHAVEDAAVAEAAGADYLVVGTIYPSDTHPGKTPEGPALLEAIAATVRLPFYAIGGITAATAGECIRRGAHGVAVIRAISDAPDPETAARELLRAIQGRVWVNTEARRHEEVGVGDMIEVTINGDRRQVQDGQTLAQYLQALRLEPRMVVVERNGEIVARDRLGETPLLAGDRLEIVQMMAGG